MSLASGTRLGPYEIVAMLGAGGMGEVYEAKDTRLDRTVAIKILPPEVSSDPDRRARFAREAKTVAGLNHPHICSLFDVGEAVPTGPQPLAPGPSPVSYLVMEHLTGETLAQRLERGPLPLEQAATVATEIADALAAAHRQGVVHRDLKPGNIMLTKSGVDAPGTPHVKLLDFGLAKLVAPLPGLESAAATQQALTVQGTLVGTLPYTAPEQLAAQAVDARADLFSFGAVLYEMLTGRRAFGGDNAADVIASVIGSQPPPPRTIRPEISAAVERLVVNCLAKDPSDRWQSARDAALFLKTSDSAPASAGPPARRRRWVLAAAFIGGAALGLASALGLWFTNWRSSPAPPRVMRLSVPIPSDGPLVPANVPGGGASVAISRDGRHLVYVSRRNGRNVLVLRRIDRAEDAVLQGTEGASGPFFSPDGGWVAYFTETELKKVPVTGGAPVRICEAPPCTRGGNWAEDDTIYFTPDFTSGVQQVPSAGGRPLDLTRVDIAAKEANHLFPEAVRGTDQVLFTVWKGGSFDEASVSAVSSRTGRRTPLVERASNARYLPQGYLVFARAGSLLAVPFDPKALAVLGPAVPVVEGVWNDPGTGAAHYGVSDTGTLVYAPGHYTRPRQRLVWVDRRGKVEPLPLEPGFYDNPRLSPDGRQIALAILNDIYVYDLRNGTLTRTTVRAVNQVPVWSPDGRRIVFNSSQDSTRASLYWVDPASGEEPKQLGRGGEVQFPGSWSHDGATLAYAEIKEVDPETDFDIWLLSGGGPWTPARLIATPFKDDDPMFSPDGRALAWVSNDTGREQVYVRPYPGNGRTLVSTDGGTEPVWSQNGAELFYRKDHRVFGVPVDTKVGVPAGRPSLLFEGDFAMGSGARPDLPGYDVAPDGRFLMVTSASDADSPARLDIVLNWLEELRAKVNTRR